MGLVSREVKDGGMCSLRSFRGSIGVVSSVSLGGFIVRSSFVRFGDDIVEASSAGLSENVVDSLLLLQVRVFFCWFW